MAVLEETIDGTYADLDFTRIYGSGQSAGSMATQGFVRTNPEFYAAAASTSGLAVPDGTSQLPEGAGGAMPDFVITGQSDLDNLMPDLWGSEMANEWITYLFDVNNMPDAQIGTADDEHEFINDRTKVYTWENSDGVPMVKYGYIPCCVPITAVPMRCPSCGISWSTSALRRPRTARSPAITAPPRLRETTR